MKKKKPRSRIVQILWNTNFFKKIIPNKKKKKRKKITQKEIDGYY